MRLIVGLGNPGAKYAQNRHNVGFMAVDEIARAAASGPWRGKFHGEITEAVLGSQKCLLLKPVTFMNRSGQAVGEAVRFYKLAPPDVIVIHDEIDLAPGKLRIKEGGGHAGHNGLRSIHDHIGPDYLRLRIGVGHPGRKEAVPGYVLHDFAKADEDWLGPMIGRIGQNAALLASGDAPRFLSAVAANAPKPPKKAQAEPPAPKAPQPEPPRSKLAELLGKMTGKRP